MIKITFFFISLNAILKRFEYLEMTTFTYTYSLSLLILRNTNTYLLNQYFECEIITYTMTRRLKDF